MRSLKLLSLASTTIGLAALTNPAFAQVDDEIIATGLRQAYQGDFAPLEIPQVDQKIDSEALAAAGVLTLDQALDLSASVARQNNFGGLWNSFSIRGFSGDINLPSGFLVNGFNAGRGFAGPRDLAGIESVDVLKGPRSALYGRGEIGGTINLVTKRPQFETGGYIKGTIGSWNQYRAEGDVQTVYGDNDDLGIRLVGFFEDAESFREGKETQKHGFYPSVTLNIGDDSTLAYELEYTSQELPQDRGVIYSEEFGFSPRRVFVGEPDSLIDTKVVGHQLEFQHDFSDNWNILLGAGYRETSLFGDSFETNFGTAEPGAFNRQTFFNDGSTITRFFRFRDYQAEYVVLRGEVTGEFETGNLRHRLIAGIDYDNFNNAQRAERFRGGGIGDRTGADFSAAEAESNLLLDLNNPVFGQFDRPIPNLVQFDRVEIQSGIGLYVQDQIDLTDKLQVRFGGRFDDFDQSLDNLLATPVTTSESSNTYFSPQVGAVYSVNDGVSLYGSYGEGIRQLSGTDAEGDSFEPNRSKAAEFGVKADLSRISDSITGTASATLFQVDQSNILISDVDNAGFAIPAGEARSRGLELDANVTFQESLNLWASYAYTDAVYTNGGFDPSFFRTFEDGTRLTNSPEHQISLQLSKNLELGERDAQLGAGLLYVSDRAGGVGIDFNLPDYVTARIFGEIEVVENVNLRLDIDNLFNETFYTDSFENIWVQPGAPRRFRVSAAYNF